MTRPPPGGDPLSEIPAAPGAYLLLIDLATPLVPALPGRPATRLEPGRSGYCGSAWGPGGLRARLARHLRRDKTQRWHVDRLAALGQVVGLIAVPGARECALRAALQDLPGVSAPLPGFGSSDCRTCPAHLLALPGSLDAAACAPCMAGVHRFNHLIILIF